MTMTITIPDRLARRLQEQASIRRRSAEDIALDILRDAFIDALYYGVIPVVKTLI